MIFPPVLVKFDCDAMKALFVALSYRKGASLDCSSTTDDRGHASTKSVAAYASIVSPAGIAVRSSLPHVAGCFDPDHIRAYQICLTNEKKLATNSIHTAVAALRFLYRVNSRKNRTSRGDPDAQEATEAARRLKP